MAKYKPEHCAKLVEVMAEGHGVAEFCKVIDISEPVFYESFLRNPEFKTAYALAKFRCLAWWQRYAKENMGDKNFNDRAWWRQVLNRFRSEYAEGHLINFTRFCKDETGDLSELDMIRYGLMHGKLTPDDAVKISQSFLNIAKTKELSEIHQKLEKIEQYLPQLKDYLNASETPNQRNLL